MSTILLRSGTVFDGLGGPGKRQDVLVVDGRVAEIGTELSAPPDAEIVDVHGNWVCPGFVDNHTHYDAEVELLPSLGESVRHGVTTIIMGSCGLSMAVGRPVDLADMFCRVEGIPRTTVLPAFERIMDWETPTEYLAHLDGLALGPNVALLLGHSTIRTHVMGIDRALDSKARPTRDELDRMVALVDEALDAGYLGLSINTLPWDKMDGDEYRSRPTPSVFAGWSEYRYLSRTLRERGRILQGVPDISNKVNALLFFGITSGIGRKGLKTMVISLVDAKADRFAFRIVGTLANLTNTLFGGDIRFQSLPNPFDLWVDGIEVPVFEEFGAGTEALHLSDPAERAALLRDPAYRQRFRKQWTNWLAPRAYHRKLTDTEIKACPDASMVGKSFAEVAEERGVDAVDLLLDTVAEYGDDVRWFTVLGNDRPEWLRWIVAHDAALIGFSDAGAHLRNMAYYNFPLRLLRLVKDAKEAGNPVMTVGEAVRRLTSEQADFLAIDAGRLIVGARADIAIVDPSKLDARLDEIHEAEIPGFEGLRRLVRRHDDVVPYVLINGRFAWREGAFADELGSRPGFGRVLRAEEPTPAPADRQAAA